MVKKLKSTKLILFVLASAHSAAMEGTSGSNSTEEKKIIKKSYVVWKRKTSSKIYVYRSHVTQLTFACISLGTLQQANLRTFAEILSMKENVYTTFFQVQLLLNLFSKNVILYFNHNVELDLTLIIYINNWE